MKPLQPKEWDRDKVWNNIERELRKKKRRRGFLLFWLGAGALLAVLAVLLWLTPNEPQLANEPKKESSANFEADLDRSDSSLTQKSEAKVFSGSLLSKKQATTAQRENFTTGTLTNQSVNPTETSDFVFTRKETADSSDSSTLPSSTTSPASSTVEADTSLQKVADRMAIFSPIDRLPMNILDKPAEVILLQKPTMPGAVLPLLLRLETTLSTGAVIYEGSEMWKQAKESSESFEYASTSTIGLDWYFAKNWYAFTGLSYQLIRTRYEFTSSQSTTRQIESDSAIIYQLNGQSFYEPGILQETRTTRRFILHNNALHRLSIPLGIGFTQPIDRFQLEARIGTRFQFIQRFDGITLDEITNQHLLNNDEINERYYQNNPSVDFTTALLLNYPLQPGSYLFLGVQYKHSGIIQLGAVPNTTAYRLWGAQVGWKFDW